MDEDLKLPSLYQPESIVDLLTPDTVSNLLLGFTAGLDSLTTYMQERGGVRYDSGDSFKKYWCKFCSHLRRDLHMENKCLEWDRKVTQVLLEEKDEEYPNQKKEFGHVFRCYAGILNLAEVIHLGDQPFAVLYGGQLKGKKDISEANSIRNKLTVSDFGLTTEQIDYLITLFNEDNNALVTDEQLEKRDRMFHEFAHEFEVLLNKLYKERRHSTEEALLHVIVTHILSMNAISQLALWESFTKLFTELRRTTGLVHIEWFMGSEEERFHFTAKTNSTKEWRRKTLSLGVFWQDMLNHSGETTDKRWDTKIRKELDLTENDLCLIYPTTCLYGVPSHNVPALLVMVCHKADKGLLEALLSRVASEIKRGVSMAISQIEKNQVIQATAALGAYVGHDMKAPLQVLVNVVPAIRGRITKMGISDTDLLSYLKRCENAVESARNKAAELEEMPIRDFIVKPQKKRIDLVDMLDSVIELTSDMGTSRSITVKWTHRPDEPIICDLDSRYMSVALHAVLDNAVKFSFAAKTVYVSLKLEPEKKAILEISNFGIGIPPEKIIAIFEFGKRGEVTDKKGIKRAGSGLGLPLAKRIIEAHQGSMQISSYSTIKPPLEIDNYLSHVVTVTIRLPI